LLREILVLLALATVAIAQQPQKALTLQDCIRLAESVPNVVTIAEQERRIADRDLIQARAGFLPQSQVQSSFTYNSPNAHDRSQPSFVALNGIREYLLLGQVTQEFDTSGKLRAEYQHARANQAVARAEYEITRRDLRRAVTTAYYRLLLTRHLAAVLRDALQESRAFEQRTKLLFENGEAAQADVIKASALAARSNKRRWRRSWRRGWPIKSWRLFGRRMSPRNWRLPILSMIEHPRPKPTRR
jgi:outer membrane protein TolC